MKSSSRSHRIPSSSTDPPDDWVDGSWTVDCICGVNFDDGEEMVSCDECGVWVHTRCSHFVKGETSYSCDKCKGKNGGFSGSRSNDSEETEVAQLLVELPTKTVKMKSGSSTASYGFKGSAPPRSTPYKVRAARPYEERVHVQGIPGGDPALFQGISSIFTAQLWKSTGYVPKKFSLRYREFPGGWEEQKPDVVPEVEDGDNKGAGVLYSLSKDAAPSGPFVGMRPKQEKCHSNGKASKDKKKSKSRDAGCKDVLNVMNKERDLVRPFMLHSGKRKREEIVPSKDRARRKKSKETVKEFDFKKDTGMDSKSAISPSDHASYFGHSHHKDLKFLKHGITDCEHEPRKDTGSEEDASEVNMVLDCHNYKGKTSVASLENLSEALSARVYGLHYSADVQPDGDKVHLDSSKPVGCPAGGDAALQPLLVQDDARFALLKDKGDSVDKMEIKGGPSGSQTIDSQRSESLRDDIANAAPDCEDKELLEKRNNSDMVKSLHQSINTEGDDGDASVGTLKSDSAGIDVKSSDTIDDAQHVSSSPLISENHEENGVATTYSNSNGPKKEELEREAETDCIVTKANEVCSESLPVRHSSDEQGCHTSLLNSMAECKSSPPVSSSQSKSVSVVKSTSKPSKSVVSNSLASDKNRSLDSGGTQPIGKQVHLKTNSSTKKDKPSCGLSRNDDKHEPVTTTTRDRPKSSIHPSSISSHPSKTYSSHDSKRSSLDVKDSAAHKSSKASSIESRPQQSIIGEHTGSLQTHAAIKSTSSTLQPRGERVLFSNSKYSSKTTTSTPGNPPVSSISPAGLSDEELALLLHQELNSSPRVPRVPRVRHAGNVPQLSSASGAGMPVKRTSGPGAKELYPFSRRKSEDLRGSQEIDKDVKRKYTVPSSPESAKTKDSLNPAEKGVAQVSATAADSVPTSSDANEKKLSKRSSPKTNSEDDTASKGPVHRTLPALIAEIMSKGRRMTYEELCNAVLPHWINLRKHNGERYAYSSHSQAVLDCLRNRSEWARLVDRGPKTNPSRKKRKNDVEHANTESEDNGCGRKVSLKDKEAKNLESSREEYPKGKRNARKRRRFTQGRGGNDARKRRKAEMESDDDSASFSGSSESESSEDDSKSQERHEASGSSDEAATMF